MEGERFKMLRDLFVLLLVFVLLVVVVNWLQPKPFLERGYAQTSPPPKTRLALTPTIAPTAPYKLYLPKVTR
jgi:hypothetical protein